MYGVHTRQTLPWPPPTRRTGFLRLKKHCCPFCDSVRVYLVNDIDPDASSEWHSNTQKLVWYCYACRLGWWVTTKAQQEKLLRSEIASTEPTTF